MVKNAFFFYGFPSFSYILVRVIWWNKVVYVAKVAYLSFFNEIVSSKIKFGVKKQNDLDSFGVMWTIFFSFQLFVNLSSFGLCHDHIRKVMMLLYLYEMLDVGYSI